MSRGEEPCACRHRVSATWIGCGKQDDNELTDILRDLGPIFLGSRLKRLAERMQAGAARILADAGLPLQPAQAPLLAALDIRVCRNAFGAQRESFETDLHVPVLGEQPYRAVFIRGPVVEEAGEGVEVLCRLDSGQIVAVRQGPLLATAFHPEVTDDLRFHEYFLGIVRGAKAHAPA